MPSLDALGDEALVRADAKPDELAFRRLLPACQSHADETKPELDSVNPEIPGKLEGMGEAVENRDFRSAGNRQFTNGINRPSNGLENRPL